jgi:hypothetical protein
LGVFVGMFYGWVMFFTWSQANSLQDSCRACSSVEG